MWLGAPKDIKNVIGLQIYEKVGNHWLRAIQCTQHPGK